MGTIVGGLVNEGGCDGGIVCAGIFQLLFFWLIIPYIWGIVTGCKAMNN